MPQVLVNVRGVDREGLDAATRVWEAVAAEEQALADSGRVLLRASGTEPLIRVMVEAADEARAHEVAQRLADIVSAELTVA